MGSMESLMEELYSPTNNKMLVCPLQEGSTSFQLVDEAGEGRPYAGIFYEVIDRQGQTYQGMLDAEGNGRVDKHYVGPISLRFEFKYAGADPVYSDLIARAHYPLEITDLQVCAEQTRYVNGDGSRTRDNPAQAKADEFYQVEVRDFVRYVSHLPPAVERHYPLGDGARRLLKEYGKRGVCLSPNRHTVLEVRPLRALRPMLSSNPEFCALNLYQLALMATLSYNPFGQAPDEHPVTAPSVTFPVEISVGHWFGDALGKFSERWRLDKSQVVPYYPLYEEVAYSHRLEIVPFDPALYAMNDPGLKTRQESPSTVHFLDDVKDTDATNTQAFITHNSDVILIAIRGTNEKLADGLRDADALRVPFEQGQGQVHRGFYEAAAVAFNFVVTYLEKFHVSQHLIICGHSLGGAVALLLAEMLRRRQPYNIQLYTYGAPRAGDTTFMQSAAELIHHRTVNDNDPVPSLPAPWMNTDWDKIRLGLLATRINATLGMRLITSGLINSDEVRYEHHGTLRHFLPVQFTPGEQSAVLWTPGCETITEKALCERALNTTDGLPNRASFVRQIVAAGDHSMTASYIPACWATLRRYQEALANQSSPVTAREQSLIAGTLASIEQQLSGYKYSLRSPDPYMRHVEIKQQLLEAELQKVRDTQKRLGTLRYTKVNEAQVYGSLAGQADVLNASLARWTAHKENLRHEQLAMAPDLSQQEKDQMRWLESRPPGPNYEEIVAMLDSQTRR